MERVKEAGIPRAWKTLQSLSEVFLISWPSTVRPALRRAYFSFLSFLPFFPFFSDNRLWCVFPVSVSTANVPSKRKALAHLDPVVVREQARRGAGHGGRQAHNRLAVLPTPRYFFFTAQTGGQACKDEGLERGCGANNAPGPKRRARSAPRGTARPPGCST